MFLLLPQVMEFEQAEQDADMALRLEAPLLNPKTLLRRGTARLGLKKIAAARADFKQVVSLEPSNRCIWGCGHRCGGPKCMEQSIQLLSYLLHIRANLGGALLSVGGMVPGSTTGNLLCRQAREELRALEGVTDEAFAGGSQLVGNAGAGIGFDMFPADADGSGGGAFN